MTALSDGAPEQAPRWDLMDTESCVGGIRFLAPSLFVWGYVGIYRGRSTSVELWWAHESGGAPRGIGCAPYLVPTSKLPWHRVQVYWVIFGKKITFQKGLFRLDSV